VCSLFFRLGRGRLLHNVWTLVFVIPIQDRTVRFTISSPRVSLSILRCSCSFKSRSLIPFLPFWCVRPLEVPLRIVPGPGFPSFLFDRRSCMTVSLMPRHSCKVSHSYAGGAGTLHRPGSISAVVGGALRLYARPHAASSMLRQFPLRPLS
jgi:hypothetical protein